MDGTRSLLHEVIEETRDEASAHPVPPTDGAGKIPAATEHAGIEGQDGLCLCLLRGFHNGVPILDVPGRSAPVRAIAVTCSLSPDDAGRIVAVAFDRSNRERPIILGRVVAGLELAGAAGTRLALSGDQEVSLRCGKASITMSADGTVAIRGVNVITRASHTNRIRGGNVQIN